MRPETFPKHPGFREHTLIKNAWTSWLTLMPWSDFFTGTFEEERPSPRSCLGCVRGLREYLLRYPWGRAQIFAVVEGGESKRLHVHALVGWSGGHSGMAPPSKVRRHAQWDYWHSRYGRARSEPVARAHAAYCAKYVVKSGLETDRILFLTDPGWPPIVSR